MKWVFTVTEIGSRLKEERLSKGYSIDDLQKITKIQKRYLLAIEEGDYANMPGSFYVRAFIKQYAEAVDLDGEELLTLYANEVPGVQVEQVTQSMSQSPSRRKTSSGPSSKALEAMPKYIAALFIVVIIVAIALLYQAKSKTGEPDALEDTPAVEIETKPTPQKPVQRDEQEQQDVTEEQPTEEVDNQQVISQGIIEPDGITTTYTLANAEEFKIRIEVLGDTWVGVQDENSTELVQPQANVFKAGDVVEVDASTFKSARIRLGASQNAKVYINDELLQYAQNVTTQNIIIVLEQQSEQPQQ